MGKKRDVAKTAPSIDPSQLQLLAIPEVAKLLAIGRTTVYELINARKLQTVKIGTARRVLVVSVQQYIQNQLQTN